jgi:hypothetical protein
MAQRSFRQRPLEINKPLELVRDISFLDTADGLPLEILQNQAVAEPVKKEVRLLRVYPINDHSNGMFICKIFSRYFGPETSSSSPITLHSITKRRRQ